MESIVVATDGSEQGRTAVEAAAERAAQAVLGLSAFGSSRARVYSRQRKRPVPPARLPRAEEDPVLREALEIAESFGVTVEAELLVGNPRSRSFASRKQSGRI